MGVNYQMQIVIKLLNGTTKVAQNDSEQPILPNSQLFQSLPTTDDQFWGGGKLPNANCGHQTTNCNSTNHKHYFTCKALKMKSQFTFGSLPPPGTNHL